MRHYVLSDVSQFMKETYDHQVAPDLKRRSGEIPATGAEVHRVMRDKTMFQFYSTLRNNAQGLVWRSVLPGIEREASSLAERAGHNPEAKGSLNLDPDFEVPDNISQLDVHHMPGNYHSEYLPDDASMGALYEEGLRVFFMGFRSIGGAGATHL